MGRKINVRYYGKEPFQVAVIHGGPGAPGSVAAIAKELSKNYGVLEPIQTKTSLKGQVLELYEVLRPLENIIEDFRFYLFKKCGHSPWKEQYAKNLFYKIIREEIDIN